MTFQHLRLFFRHFFTLRTVDSGTSPIRRDQLWLPHYANAGYYLSWSRLLLRLDEYTIRTLRRANSPAKATLPLNITFTSAQQHLLLHYQPKTFIPRHTSIQLRHTSSHVNYIYTLCPHLVPALPRWVLESTMFVELKCYFDFPTCQLRHAASLCLTNKLPSPPGGRTNKFTSTLQTFSNLELRN